MITDHTRHGLEILCPSGHIYRQDFSGRIFNQADRISLNICQPLRVVQGRGNVIVIAATNRPDKLDDALIRAGRFDRLLFIPPPDASARASILRVHTRNVPLAGNVDLNHLASKMEGYIHRSCCDKIAFPCLLERRSLENALISDFVTVEILSTQDFLNAQRSLCA